MPFSRCWTPTVYYTLTLIVVTNTHTLSVRRPPNQDILSLVASAEIGGSTGYISNGPLTRNKEVTEGFPEEEMPKMRLEDKQR